MFLQSDYIHVSTGKIFFQNCTSAHITSERSKELPYTTVHITRSSHSKLNPAALPKDYMCATARTAHLMVLFTPKLQVLLVKVTDFVLPLCADSGLKELPRVTTEK